MFSVQKSKCCSETAPSARLFFVLGTVVCCLATCGKNIVTVYRTTSLLPCLPVLGASSNDCLMFSVS